MVSMFSIAALFYCSTRTIVQFPLLTLYILPNHSSVLYDFSGLEVACWPLVPKFAGSIPAEAVGFVGRKKILDASVPFRKITACKRNPKVTWKSPLSAKFSAISRP